jgi:hypothetical protein
VDTSLDLIQCVNGIELAELEPKTASGVDVEFPLPSRRG